MTVTIRALRRLLAVAAAAALALPAGASPAAAQSAHGDPAGADGPLGAEGSPGADIPPAALADGPPTASVPEDSVWAVVHAFHEALAAGDSARALELLHPDVRVYESGHAETLDEYRSGHLAADIAFSSAVERTVESERVFGSDGWAVYLSEDRVAGRFRGNEIDAAGAETMVLVRADGGWRIRHIHWSSR